MVRDDRPDASTKVQAGCAGTPKCPKSLPSSSTRWVMVRPWRATKARYDEVSPDHVTPTTSTLPASFWETRSTEGASALQLLQVGAQNQNATGRPV